MKIVTSCLLEHLSDAVHLILSESQNWEIQYLRVHYNSPIFSANYQVYLLELNDPWEDVKDHRFGVASIIWKVIRDAEYLSALNDVIFDVFLITCNVWTFWVIGFGQKCKNASTANPWHHTYNCFYGVY